MTSSNHSEEVSVSPKSARWPSASQITAVAAILTSLMALAVSLYETRIMRAWQQASTQPIVEIRLDVRVGVNPSNMSFRLINTGQGTAYIEGIRASIDGAPTSGLDDLLEQWNASPISKTLETTELTYIGYLEAGGERIPATTQISFPEASALDPQGHFAFANEMAEKIGVQVCYCSVFDQCWINDYQTRERAKPVSVCPADFT
ncbi:MAG: hypothetical protein AAFP97_06155 [Pseudomonadota bacterium]